MERGQQPNIEQLLNKIALLRKALEFYGDEKNHLFNPREINSYSATQKDKGLQARFALEQIKNIEDYNSKMIKEYEENIDKINGLFVDLSDDKLTTAIKIEKTIEKFKKYGDKDI